MLRNTRRFVAGRPANHVLLTGSRADSFSDEPWVRVLRGHVSELLERRKPLLGICFGHQLIAHCLGAPVGRAPQGWGMGRHVLGSNYFRYVRDPWGSYAEYSFDIDFVEPGSNWPAADHPPEDSLYVWGPSLPADFVTNFELRRA